MTVCSLLFFLPSQASAQCANPTGTEAQIVYNKDAGVPQYCNNTIWKPMGPGYSGPTGCESVGSTCSDGSFYIGQAGSNDLYATAVADETTGSWNNGSTNWAVTGITDTADGYANTAALLALSDVGAPYFAAGYCAGLDAHNQTDWYLPARNELDLFWNGGAPIAGVLEDGTYYWTSTENDDREADVQRFNDGIVSSIVWKNSTRAIRCVRQGTVANPPQIIADGLVGHWKLDETSGTDVIDYASNNNGTMQGGLTGGDSVDGRIGTALNFDGDNDYVDIGNSSDLDLYDELTISAWINPDDMGEDEGGNDVGTIFSRYIGDSSGYIFHIWGDNATYNGISLWSESELDDVWADNVLTPGIWQHVLVTKTSADDVIIYVNGVAVGSGTLDLASEPGANAAIGTWSAWPGDAVFDGGIDDVRVYNRVLTADEIAQLYRSWDGKITYDADTRVPKFFNGDEWRPMGPVKYIPNAVAFDGATTSLLAGAALSGVTDGTKASGSFWAQRNSSGSAHLIFTAQSGRLWARFRPADDRMEIEGYNVDADQVISINSTTQITDTDWHHFMYSFDMDVPGSAKLYMDGVDVTNVAVFGDNDSGGGIGTDNNIEFSATNYAIGSNVAQTNSFLDGSIADLWVDINTYIDLSDPASRARFYDNGPVDLGTDGSKATGTAPDIFLSGDTDDWHTNKATGGGFTESGELTTAATSPVSQISASRSNMGATLTGTTKWQDGILANDGKIYAIPVNATDILIIDPATGTATRSAMGADLSGTLKWGGAVMAPNGKIYGIPLDATDILIIDPATGTATLDNMGADLSGTLKWGGGALGKDGKIYAMPRNATDILIIDPLTETATRSAMGADLTGTYKWLSGFLGSDGKIYGVPQTIDSILIIDTDAGTATLDNMGAALPAGASTKWFGGVAGPDGKIYGIPRDSTDVLIIDPASDTATLDNMGADLTGTEKWIGGSVGRDGKIYGIPNDATDILVIDPASQTATRDNLGVTLTGTGKWSSSVTASNGTIYAIPKDSTDILIIQTAGICSNPTRTAGTIVYNGDDNLMQYCDGENWRQIGP